MFDQGSRGHYIKEHPGQQIVTIEQLGDAQKMAQDP